MQTARLGELFDGLICSVLQGMNPAVGADDRLDQALVMRAFRSVVSCHHACGAPCLDRPGALAFFGRAIAIGGAHERNMYLSLGDDDALKHLNRVGRSVSSLIRLNGGKDRSLDL